MKMTTNEFEDYLKSIEGLLNGYFPDRPNIYKRGFFSIGDGWLQLVHDLIEELRQINWDRRIYQVKEKFAGLRFYSSLKSADGIDISQQVYDICDKYEKLSYQVCAICGKKGYLDDKGYWLYTHCDEHQRKERIL